MAGIVQYNDWLEEEVSVAGAWAVCSGGCPCTMQSGGSLVSLPVASHTSPQNVAASDNPSLSCSFFGSGIWAQCGQVSLPGVSHRLRSSILLGWGLIGSLSRGRTHFQTHSVVMGRVRLLDGWCLEAATFLAVRTLP